MKTFTAKSNEHSSNVTRRACRNTRVGERFAIEFDGKTDKWVRVKGGMVRSDAYERGVR